MPLQRLMAGMSIQPDTGCWLWQKGKDKDGYGRIKVEGRNARTHKVMLELKRGPVPAGMEVCHTCDNRPCINPKHLFLDTKQGNMDDRQQKARQPYGSRNGQSKLTENLVRWIKLLLRVRKSDAYLADKFGVSVSTIRKIRTGRTWKQI